MIKYHSRKITVDGETFDSQKEYRRWQALRLLERAGAIWDLKRQVRFELLPEIRESPVIGPRGGSKPGKQVEKPVYYIADFVYYKDGRLVVEDAKGVRTDVYIIKRKLMLHIHGIKILET